MVESVEFSRPGCVQFGYACHCHRWRNSRSTRGTSPYCSQIDGATHMSLVYSCERPLPQKSCAYSTRSCNTDKYIFSLLVKHVESVEFSQLTIYSLQFCFDNAVSQMPFNTFKCTKRTTAYGTIQYMDPWMDDRTNRLPGKRKENMAQSLLHKFHPISATSFAHLCGIWHK